MGERLKGKVALIFGAGSSGPGWGNGKAVAVLYAREGAWVFAVDLRAEAAWETQRLIEEEGGQCTALTADVTDSAQILGVVKIVLAIAGRLDVLHNNVGIMEMGDPIEASEASWRRVIDTSLTSVFLTCKHVLPIMLAQGAGSIINISSLASIQINAYPYTSYYAAKAGLNHLTRSLAVRYAPHNVRVNAVLPGVIDTPLIYTQIAGQFDDIEEMRRQRRPARWGGWVMPGTWRTPRCSWPVTKPNTSPAYACPSMAARPAQDAKPAKGRIHGA